MSKPIKIIDLFSGPGGLAEGFATNTDAYKIAISIEKEKSAHRTLTLRAFFRQYKDVPDEYYQFLHGNLGDRPEEILYSIPAFKKEVKAAHTEAQCLTLGEDNLEIKARLDTAIGNDECIHSHFIVKADILCKNVLFITHQQSHYNFRIIDIYRFVLFPISS